MIMKNKFIYRPGMTQKFPLRRRVEQESSIDSTRTVIALHTTLVVAVDPFRDFALRYSPNPVFSLNSSGVLKPCRWKYATFSSLPCISLTTLCASKAGSSSFSCRLNVGLPSMSSSPSAQSSEYSFFCLRSRCNKIYTVKTIESENNGKEYY